MTGISEMQKKIRDHIARYVEEHGYPPSVREIAAAVGLKSPSTVHFHLDRMEKAGILEKGAGKGRALRLVDAPPPPDRIPIVGDVAAGAPILAQEHVEDWLTFDAGAPADELFALRVRGESMLGAGILPGDLVVVRRQREADPGDIVVAMIDGDATVKRLVLRGGRVWLMPENEGFAPIDGSRAQILGRVRAVVRRY